MTPSVFSYVIGPSFIAAIAGFLLLFYTFKINDKANVNYTRTGVLLIAQLILIIIISIAIQSADNKRSVNELQRFLIRNHAKIEVDGQPLDSAEAKKIIAVLKTIHSVDAHHSHAINRIEVKIITAKDTLHIILGRDSEYKNEYWIFKRNDEAHEFGRITTNMELKIINPL